jgi:hypothetical protein
MSADEQLALLMEELPRLRLTPETTAFLAVAAATGFRLLLVQNQLLALAEEMR